MSFAKTARRVLAALGLALVLALPVSAAQAGAALPVTVRTDGTATDAVYTVSITPQDSAPAPAQSSLQIKSGGTAYFTGFAFTEPGDYRYRVTEAKGTAADTTYDARAYTVTVRVTSRADGTLHTELWAVRDGETAKAAGVLFVNRYDPPAPTAAPAATADPTAAPTAVRAAKSRTPGLPQTGDDFPVEALAAAMCAGVVGFGTAFTRRK